MNAKRLPFASLTNSERDRFWSKIHIKSDNECWNWKGSQIGDGYGNVTIRSLKAFISTRIAWLITRGVDPYPYFVLHRCDNPPCCNPNHLFIGTNQDNMTDSARKGRKPRKLTVKKVHEIRKMLEQGLSQREIASRFGIAQVIVSDIKLKRTWKFV